MKIEFLPDGADVCPLIRLYDFSKQEVAQLVIAARALATGDLQRFPLHDQPWVTSIDDCMFVWAHGSTNVDVSLGSKSEPFVLTRNHEGWLEVASLISPFAQKWSGGWSWLTDGEINVLFSYDGSW